MMDPRTIDIYNNESKKFAEKHIQLKPDRLYSLVETFFKKGRPTLDLGCGMGRDTHWLNENEYPALGLDAAEGMLGEARKLYPHLMFEKVVLPDLNKESGSFENIFCCAVLMHVPRAQLISTALAILNTLTTRGRLILSFRSGNDENDGRLFESYHPGQIAQLFESLGGKVLLFEQQDQWNNLVIEKSDITKREGIQQIQDVISRDKKTATYKLALIRALCEISRYESHAVTWYREADEVLIPLRRIAIRWILYYWPLVMNDVRQTTNSNMAFETMIRELPYKKSEFQLLKHQLEFGPKVFEKLIKKVSDTIIKGPIHYSGGGKNNIFRYFNQTNYSVYPELQDSTLGVMTVSISMWRDINFFSHWIEDSLNIQWAELSDKINKNNNFAFHFDLITKTTQADERSTYMIRKLFSGSEINCVWTGKKIEKFAVDHMIPWSLWKNNDLWNLLPSDSNINNKKSDFIPSVKLIRRRFDSIQKYWRIYEEKYPELFDSQIKRSLGINSKECFSSLGCEALVQLLTRVSLIQGGVFWDKV